MCGRFAAGHLTQAQMLEIMEGFLGATAQADPAAPPAATGWNIKPTQQVHLIRREGDALLASTARWWFVPGWHRGDPAEWKATTFNARIETAADKPTFRQAWREGRCLIPTTGYFEWSGAKGAKQPWFLRPRSNAPLFFFAGLAARTPTGLNSCTILTRPAEDAIAHIHARMPVMLRETHCADWLTGDTGDAEVIETLGAGWDIDHHKVDRFGTNDDGPGLIEPQAPMLDL